MKILKIGFWALIAGLLIFVLVKYAQCNSKGKKGEKPFRCPLCSGEPVLMTASDEYTMMIDKKCYEVTEYGERLTYKQVERERCGEDTQPIKRNDTLAEYEVVSENY